MNYFLRFGHPWVLYSLIPLVIVCALLRRWLKRPVIYNYSLASALALHNYAATNNARYLFWIIRFSLLITLAFLTAKPQLVDSRSKVDVQGIDIVLVLDASGSMQFQDYADDERSRFDVAKQEAIRFVDLRHNDALGFVIFGQDAISRCPITFDKKMLKKMVQEVKLGDIDPNGTMLAKAMIAGINRLKYSQSKSKIMILLTDGEPSEGDSDPKTAIAIAKELGIKIYTIGIGTTQEGFMRHPFFGLVPKPTVNKELLNTIAQQTGGKFFMAQSAQDMRAVYNTIDQLEKTRHEAPIFSVYWDIYWWVVVGIIMLLILQLLLSIFVWYGVNSL